MKYTVAFKPAAEQELANIWSNAPDRAAVTAAAHEIEIALQRDPVACGESRGKGTRVLFHPPLVVQYRVNEADRMVRVVEVKRYGRAP